MRRYKGDSKDNFSLTTRASAHLVLPNRTNNIIYRDIFPPSRQGSHARGISTIFSESTTEMMNSVGQVMPS